MNKKTVGIISVVASCMAYGITKHFFDKDRKKKCEEENKMVHDSVEKIFSESRDKRMEKLNLEFEKEMEESRKKHEEIMKKMSEEHQEKMKELQEERKKLEEKRKVNEELINDLKVRNDERINSAQTVDEIVKASEENRKDIHEVYKTIFGQDFGTTRIVFKGKLAEMMKEDN